MRLRLRDVIVEPDGFPLVMGILNTTPDSVSDGQRYLTLDAQIERARELAAGGAHLIDVGGESGRTDRPAVSEDDEIRIDLGRQRIDAPREGPGGQQHLLPRALDAVCLLGIPRRAVGVRGREHRERRRLETPP